ncbi:MAG: hypothetical protein D6698_02940 [Gammaproteobacteria bacterium]|nr:MAG: hypothetical protein D6698_02940 [Gammaproteobacteria bacterium]
MPVGILLLWLGAILGLKVISSTAYGVDEAAARSLLLDWSVIDRLANPIAYNGIPDFRILMFAPVAVYWTGSILAAKVWMLILAFAAVFLFYRWSRSLLGDETALFASGLLLFSPILLVQAETLSAGPLLLLLFAAGAWLNRKYLASKKVLGGWYFLHLIVVAVMVSLHPAGLAYPVVLLAFWWRQRQQEPRRSKDMLIGTVLACIFVLLMWAGWTSLDWFVNPFAGLARGLSSGFSPEPEGHWWLAGLLFLVWLVLIFAYHEIYRGDLLAGTLALSTILGAVAADNSWSLLVYVFVLYFGLHGLIRMHDRIDTPGWLSKRGGVMLLLFIVANINLLGCKLHRQVVADELLDSRSALLRLVGFELEDQEKEQARVKTADQDREELKIASAWPGQTMLVLKRPVFPLPPASFNEKQLREYILNMDMVIFSPDSGRYPHLVKQLSTMATETHTLFREKGGVVIGVKHQK